MVRFRALCAALLSVATLASAVAQPVQPALSSAVVPRQGAPKFYAEVLEDWVARNRPETAILVVRSGGKTIFESGYGVSAQAPTLIASLSKAMTAVCVATLIRDGQLSFDTPMRVALAGFFRRYGRPADPRFENVTVEQLLVHRSGLLGNPDGDPIGRIRRARYANGMGHLAAPQPLLAEHLQNPLARDPGTQSAYSNTGYVVLTAVIEERTNKPFEAYCREAVFDQLGISSARLHPDFRVFGGSGGWFITGADYLALMDVFDRNHPFLGDRVKAWIDEARSKWGTDPRGGWYSLGVHTIATNDGWRIAHNGLLNSRGRSAQGHPTAAIIRSFMSRAPSGVSIFAAVRPSSANSGLAELRTEIARLHAPAPHSSLPVATEEPGTPGDQ